MERIGVFGVNAAIDLLIAKDEIYRLQDGRARTERIDEIDGIEFQPGIDESLTQFPAPGVEFAGCGALKRKDRLFLVADRENRPRHALARAFAGREFGNKMIQNVPLPRACVLRLVDQDMIDAAIELVMHPA